MTAIRGYVEPNKDSDALGVHSLDQFVLQVPDAAVAQDFYGTFGLDVARDGNTLAIMTFGHEHRWGSVVEGSKTKALHHLSFGCYADDLPRLKARIEGQGIALIDPPHHSHDSNARSAQEDRPEVDQSPLELEKARQPCPEYGD